MKKILFTLIALVACLTVNAKVIKLTMSDNSLVVYTSSQLSSIDFNDDGTLTVTTFDGQVLEALDVAFDELVINDQEVIYEVKDDVLAFEADVDGVPVNLNQERPAVRMNFVYPSTDPNGDPSGHPRDVCRLRSGHPGSYPGVHRLSQRAA